MCIRDRDNIIEGGAGADTLRGDGGTDTLSYESSSAGVSVKLGTRQYKDGDAQGDDADGFENLIGSNFDDSDLFGTVGENSIWGREGNDDIRGLRGHDRLYGEGGNDSVRGDEGNDTLVGGAGNDVFVAHSADGDTDTITDFTSGDKIRIDVADPSTVTDLASLYTTLSITQATSSSNVTLTFDRGTTGTDASDYMLVLDGFTGNLTFTDFEVI